MMQKPLQLSTALATNMRLRRQYYRPSNYNCENLKCRWCCHFSFAKFACRSIRNFLLGFFAQLSRGRLHVGQCCESSREFASASKKYLYRDGKKIRRGGGRGGGQGNEKGKEDEKSPTDTFIKEAAGTAHINGICM